MAKDMDFSDSMNQISKEFESDFDTSDPNGPDIDESLINRLLLRSSYIISEEIVDRLDPTKFSIS